MIVYVAGPYSAATYDEVDANIQQVRRIAIDLWERGFVVFAPHLNTAHFEVDCKAPYDQYLRGDLEMLSRCGAIVMTPDWEKSTGARGEKEFADRAKIPVYIYPNAPRLVR